MQTPQAQAQPATPTPAPSVAGATEAAPTAPATVSGPTTVRELEALRARSTEFSSQLSSATSRRDRLVRELNREQPGPSRMGLEQRVTVLDNRILQIESDLAVTGRQLTSTQAGFLTATQQQSQFLGLSSRQLATMSNLFILFVLAPLAIAAARNMWRRGNKPPPPLRDVESAHKLDQLQQSVDTIAIEVERVSEGQRFVTKLMSEQPRPALESAIQRDMTTIQRPDNT